MCFSRVVITNVQLTFLGPFCMSSKYQEILLQSKTCWSLINYQRMSSIAGQLTLPKYVRLLHTALTFPRRSHISTFRDRHSSTKCVVVTPPLFVCVYPMHCCTVAHISMRLWETVEHLEIIVKSVHRFSCYGNIHVLYTLQRRSCRTRNVCECVY